MMSFRRGAILPRSLPSEVETLVAINLSAPVQFSAMAWNAATRALSWEAAAVVASGSNLFASRNVTISKRPKQDLTIMERGSPVTAFVLTATSCTNS